MPEALMRNYAVISPAHAASISVPPTKATRQPRVILGVCMTQPTSNRALSAASIPIRLLRGTGTNALSGLGTPRLAYSLKPCQ